MTLDRTIPPLFKSISKVHIPSVNCNKLSNGVPVYSFHSQQQEVLKIELVFDAGSIYAQKRGIGSLFTKMMLCGTHNLTAQLVVNQFDQWGGFAEFSQKTSRLHVSVYGMTRYFEKYLRGIKEILEHISFPESELIIQKQIAVQGIQLNNEKPANIASEAFRIAVFGESHPYGKVVKENDVKDVRQADLVEFHKNVLKDQSFKLFVSGELPSDFLSTLDSIFGQKELKNKVKQEISLETKSSSHILLEKKDNMQSTIRIGNILFGRKHPDAMKFQVTNTIFGGYFGSRLMKNIREEKGYTYGISSGLIPAGPGGYFMIGTDVVKENTQETIDEIKKEMSILQNEKVADSELEIVKNYMIGSLANGVNNSFDIMEKNQKIILEDFPEGYYDNYLENIKSVTAADVLEMSQKYLNYDAFFEVIVGGK